MSNGSHRFRVTPLALLRGLFGLIGDRRGNIAAMTALLIVPIVGALGMAIETGDWYMNQRAIQNAADSAALSAGLNGLTTGGVSCATAPGNFDCEAIATATQFGLVNGANNVTVTTNCYATTAVNQCSTAKTCPGGADQCYQVTITKKLPLAIMQVVGYQGDTTVGSQNAVNITATAWSRTSQSSAIYCILALTTSGTGISSAGSPNFNSGGCSLFSDGDTSCSGHPLAAVVDAAGSASSVCASTTAQGGLAKIGDAWKTLATSTNIPDGSTFCGGTDVSNYPGATISGPVDLTAKATQQYCGTVTLSGCPNSICVVSTESPGSTIIIYNGSLDLNGNTLQTPSGSGLTIVFAGSTLTDTGDTLTDSSCTKHCGGGVNLSYFPLADGTLDFAAPKSGTWSGVAVYVDPYLTSGVDSSFAGNKGTWDITGLYYSPNANMSFSGAENKASNGLNCFSLVTKTFSTNGTGDIFSNATSQCSQAGLVPPTGTGATRAGLVG